MDKPPPLRFRFKFLLVKSTNNALHNYCVAYLNTKTAVVPIVIAAIRNAIIFVVNGLTVMLLVLIVLLSLILLGIS